LPKAPSVSARLTSGGAYLAASPIPISPTMRSFRKSWTDATHDGRKPHASASGRAMPPAWRYAVRTWPNMMMPAARVRRRSGLAEGAFGSGGEGGGVWR